LLGSDLLPLVRFVDCGRTPEACEGKDIKGYPTWTIEDWGGKELARHYGIRTPTQLLSFASCDVVFS
jgi:hypothetical protein